MSNGTKSAVVRQTHGAMYFAQGNAVMSQGNEVEIDQIDFEYAPDQPLSHEQRIEVLEFQVAEMREQIGALVEQLMWMTASETN
ncbi:MAG TPA: hypothetical protein VFI31_14950 [Pirellulales bacterium]|nr:hypothetical protein [Pirellulales bacterium]